MEMEKYLDFRGAYMVVLICQNSLTIHLKSIHFIVWKLYINNKNIKKMQKNFNIKLYMLNICWYVNYLSKKFSYFLFKNKRIKLKW